MENIKNYAQYLGGYDYTGKTPVVIDFYATWCGPCQAFAPQLERLAKEFEGKVKVLKFDVDKNEQLAMAAGIRSIPTLFFVSIDGNITRNVGALPYNELAAKTKELIV
ncbi:MAG: thioredoxin [Bacteroidaceae bacterium]|nr:thioredoxin [Bacteroidaceae bacterium]